MVTGLLQFSVFCRKKGILLFGLPRDNGLPWSAVNWKGAYFVWCHTSACRSEVCCHAEGCVVRVM